MNHSINSIIRKKTRGSKPFNIISFATHESAETIWAKNNIVIHSFDGNGFKEWNHSFRPPPKNYHLIRSPNNTNLPLEQRIPSFIEALPRDIDFDCIVMQNSYCQGPIVQAISQHLNIPSIEIQHCLPPENAPPSFIQEMKAKTTNKKVFITDYSRARWGYNNNDGVVIRHAIDAELFTVDRSNQTNHILTVANEYKDRDYFLGYSLYEKIVKGLPSKNIGNCPGLSEAAKNVEELIHGYQNSTVFLNTSLVSPVPMSLLEAAACGCAIVTTATAEIPFFFTHGENALMSNNADELRKYCIELMNNEQERIRLGDNARKMILEKCSLERYTTEWNNLFNEVCQ